MKSGLFASMLLFLFPYCFAQGLQEQPPRDEEVTDEYLCEARLPLSSLVDGITVIGDSVVVKTGRTMSSGSLKMRNDADSAIAEYAMLLELFDASGKRTYSIVFHDVYIDAAEPIYPPYKASSAPFPMSPINEVHSPIEAGATLDAIGMTPLVTSRCPAKAALSFVFLKFANGKTVIQSTPGWRKDPAVMIPTDHMVLGDCPIPEGTAATATIKLDSDGSFRALDVRSPNLPSAVARCLRRELALWDFEPALIEGRPSNSQLRLVILFDPTAQRWRRWQREYSKEVEEGVSLLDLKPWDSAEKEWNFAYCCYSFTKFHP